MLVVINQGNYWLNKLKVTKPKLISPSSTTLPLNKNYPIHKLYKNLYKLKDKSIIQPNDATIQAFLDSVQLPKLTDAQLATVGEKSNTLCVINFSHPLYLLNCAL